MRTNFTLQGLLLLTMITGSAACFKAGGPCEEPNFVENSEVGVTYKDASGNYLYAEINPLYPKDSLKVFGQDGEQLILLSHLNMIPNSYMRYHEISFGPLYKKPDDESSFSQEICKNFIVQYRHNERDTLSVCFKAEKMRCGSEFETLRVYHKGKELANVSGEVAAHISLIKP